MDSFWDKHPVCVWVRACTKKTMFFISDEREKRWKMLCLTWQMTKKWHTCAQVHRKIPRTHIHTLSKTNVFEKWQKSRTVITLLTAVILLFLISTSHRQKMCSRNTNKEKKCTNSNTNSPECTTRELQILSDCHKTNCLFQSWRSSNNKH